MAKKTRRRPREHSRRTRSGRTTINKGIAPRFRVNDKFHISQRVKIVSGQYKGRTGGIFSKSTTGADSVLVAFDLRTIKKGDPNGDFVKIKDLRALS